MRGTAVVQSLSYLTIEVRHAMHPSHPITSHPIPSHPEDDERLLLGVFFHGMGSWERLRQDTRLNLQDKIPPPQSPAAAAAAAASGVKLPKPSLLEARAAALLRKVRGCLSSCTSCCCDCLVPRPLLSVTHGRVPH